MRYRRNSMRNYALSALLFFNVGIVLYGMSGYTSSKKITYKNGWIEKTTHQYKKKPIQITYEDNTTSWGTWLDTGKICGRNMRWNIRDPFMYDVLKSKFKQLKQELRAADPSCSK